MSSIRHYIVCEMAPNNNFDHFNVEKLLLWEYDLSDIFLIFCSIYQPIDFDQDGEGDNIRFMIKRIKVHTSKALKDTTYRFPGNYGVEKFLEIFSGNKILQFKGQFQISIWDPTLEL